MKSKRILLGLLAITLVFGMMVTGCGDKDTEKPEPAKKLTITGIPSTVTTPYVDVYLLDDDFVAGNYAPTSSTVTIALKQVTVTTDTDGKKTVTSTTEDWKGKGTYDIYLIESTGDSYVFKDTTAYGIIGKEFKNETTTVAWTEFKKINWDTGTLGSIKLNISVK